MAELMAHNAERRSNSGGLGFWNNVPFAKARHHRHWLRVGRGLPADNGGVLGIKNGPDISVCALRGLVAIARMNNDDSVERPSNIPTNQAGVAAVAGCDDRIARQIIPVGSLCRNTGAILLPFVPAAIVFRSEE